MAYTYKDLDPGSYSPATYEYLKKKYPDPADKVASSTLIDGEDDLASYYENQRNRIPRGNELEGMSSDSIANLLNPPDFFPEVDRRTAEGGTMRGVSGSPAEFSSGVRMTDEERLKRISLGQGFLTAADSRNPAIDPSYLFQTPQQKAQLELDKQRLDLQKQAQELENELKRLQIRNLSTPSVRYASGGSNVQGGGVHNYGITAPSGGGYSGGTQDFHGTAPVGGGFQNTAGFYDELLGDFV